MLAGLGAVIGLAAPALLVSGLSGPMSGPARAQEQSIPDLVSRNAFRVCADPANVPMSSEDGTGFENRIAELFAEKLGLPLEYTWFPMSTGFVRNTLAANRCDVVIGYAQLHELVQNTNHYYTSTFVMIAPEGSDLADVSALSDPKLQGKRIGVIAGTAPATHMVRYGLMGGVKSYSLFADRRRMSPTEDMLDDLAAGEIDLAILWGPVGGPLVKEQHPDMVATPIDEEAMPPRMYHRITMAVRRGEMDWSRELNSLIRRNQDEINAILSEAGVPLRNDMGTAALDVSQ